MILNKIKYFIIYTQKVKEKKVTQSSCPVLCNPMDCMGPEFRRSKDILNIVHYFTTPYLYTPILFWSNLAIQYMHT